MSNRVCLLVIDPQVDFCDQNKGALAVGGADEDMKRLAAMIEKYPGDISNIQITMDSHFRLHIAHAIMWVDKNNKRPVPIFLKSGNTVPTSLTADLVENGEFRAYNPAWQNKFLNYVQKLKENGRYDLMIWPEHCIIGTPGQCLDPFFREAVSKWEERYHTIAAITTKGSNPFTEHYSAVRADVEDPKDRRTRLNTDLINLLKEYDIILGAGEALSHCFANTMRDVFEKFSVDQVKKFVLLKDATSSVFGCEQMGNDFINEFTTKGMQVATTTSFF